MCAAPCMGACCSTRRGRTWHALGWGCHGIIKHACSYNCIESRYIAFIYSHGCLLLGAQSAQGLVHRQRFPPVNVDVLVRCLPLSW